MLTSFYLPWLHNTSTLPGVLDQLHGVSVSSLGVDVVHHRRVSLHQELAVGAEKLVGRAGAVVGAVRVGHDAGGILAVCGARGGGRLQPPSSLL